MVSELIKPKEGGLHQISWFQFLPNESDLSTLPDKSAKVEHNDAATFLVLSSHVQLQKEGFLSTWTNSFVGPWDPSQGLHNPDEKIKLWLFLPGRHSSVVETAQAAVSKLRVVASGLWISPGDSEEVAAALSQALRNCIERALTGLSYMRFGDVFTKYHHMQSEDLFRRGQPTMEFIFAATEEAIFVHVILSAKHIRALSNAEIERVLKNSAHNSCLGLPVIVSPHGVRGRFTGCCASDVVKRIYSSSGKSRTSYGFVGLPHHVSQGGCQSKGQNCYVEVTLGCPKSVSEKPLLSNSNYTKNVSMPQVTESLIGRDLICQVFFEKFQLQLGNIEHIVDDSLWCASFQYSSHGCKQLLPEITEKYLVSISNGGFWDAMLSQNLINECFHHLFSREGVFDGDEVSILAQPVNH
ncbi:mediator of RNA polymerase II transcription subunit 13 [Cucumis melo var. makuwa]|uniref:Mediator of RNA polymerase II transcription subunit 13 n=1 Tax=Cucumis melo var. makuwa TaxID=1194695 RepID=A0A5A7UQ34_CUCMM|nr:mediator of RNA polymerase II transcription subunit 13 [Cucumis melo var. makuwa]TYK09962.1 mediator of RNA polymerase II transcription subunit 13 [Cucumis melo var. makuwa]